MVLTETPKTAFEPINSDLLENPNKNKYMKFPQTYLIEKICKSSSKHTFAIFPTL